MDILSNFNENENKTIVSESIADKVYNSIIDDITDSHFAQGEKLVVRELCERYGVSDTPVKQALSRLISDGLVENVSRKGMWVKNFTNEELSEIYRARLMIEEYCIDDCIELIRHEPGIKQHFEEIIEENRRFVSKLDDSKPTVEIYNKFESLDMAFHYSIVECANSEVILSLYEHLHPLMHMRFFRAPKKPSKMGGIFEDHEKIYGYMLEGDSISSKASLRKHFAMFLESAKDYKK